MAHNLLEILHVGENPDGGFTLAIMLQIGMQQRIEQITMEGERRHDMGSEISAQCA